MARYVDEWATDDERRGVDPDAWAGPGTVIDATDDDDPDRYGPDGELIEPPSGEVGEAHAVTYTDGRLDHLTVCCGMDVRELPNGDTLTDDPDRVSCSWGTEGAGPVDDPETLGPPEDVPDLGSAMAGYASAVQASTSGHESHEPARYDPETGVTCGCGEVIEGPDSERVHTEITVPDGPFAGSAVDPIRSGLPPLDPREVYTPVDLERALLECVRRLHGGLEAEAYWTEQFGNRSHELLKAQSRARLKANGGSKDVRDAQVVDATTELLDQVAEAKINMDVLKGALHTLRSVLSGLQSVGRSVGTAYAIGMDDGARPSAGRPRQQGDRR